MPSGDNSKLVQLRNETSLCLDDLTAQVKSSSLAANLRDFSVEIMELTPGFTFNQEQGKKLLDLTEDTLSRYQKRRIGDGELMDYMTKARAILKGEEKINGGIGMSFFDKVLHGKELKKQESLKKIEIEYKTVCDQLLDCEEKMAAAVEAARGHAPESRQYRDAETSYKKAKENMILLGKHESLLRKALDNATRVELIKEFNERQKEIERATGNVLGNEKELARILAEAEISTERVSSTIDKMENYGESLFEVKEEYVPRGDSEFGAKVASSERRHAMMEMDGGFAQMVNSSPEEKVSEFGSLVGADRTKE